MTNYNFITVVKLLVIFLIFVSPKEILAFYDRFYGYAEAPMQQEIFDVSEFGASPNADSDNTLVSLFTNSLIKYCNNFFKNKIKIVAVCLLKFQRKSMFTPLIRII